MDAGALFTPWSIYTSLVEMALLWSRLYSPGRHVLFFRRVSRFAATVCRRWAACGVEEEAHQITM